MSGLTVPYLKKTLDRLGVDYPANAKKKDLIALLDRLVVKYGVGDCGCKGGGSSEKKNRSGGERLKIDPSSEKNRSSGSPKKNRSGHSCSSTLITMSPEQTGSGKSLTDCEKCNIFTERSKAIIPYKEDEIKTLQDLNSACIRCSNDCFKRIQDAQKLRGFPKKELDLLKVNCEASTKSAISSNKELARLRKGLEEKAKGVAKFRAAALYEGMGAEILPSVPGAREEKAISMVRRPPPKEVKKPSAKSIEDIEEFIESFEKI